VSNERDSDEASRHGTSSTGLLRQKINEHLASAQRVIAALREEVSAYRRENTTLTLQRDRLQRALTKLEAMGLQRSKLEQQAQESEGRRRQLEQSQRELERDMQRLSARNERLERSLTQETEDGEVLRLEIACLEQQVEELRAIASLLSDDSAPPRETDSKPGEQPGS
jgi:chromosome segregation ATPase